MDLHVFTILLPAALGQIQPDVRFDDQNDRFDLTPLMQQAAYDQWGDVVDGSRESRRADGLSINNNSDTTITNATSKFMQALKVFQQNFDYNATEHFSNEGEDPNDKVQLRRDLATYLYNNQPDMDTRRSGQTEADREKLMQYAVPITIEVGGMIQVPTGDE